MIASGDWPPETPEEPHPPQKPVRRFRWVVAAAGAIALVLVIGAVVVALRAGGSGTQAGSSVSTKTQDDDAGLSATDGYTLLKSQAPRLTASMGARGVRRLSDLVCRTLDTDYYSPVLADSLSGFGSGRAASGIPVSDYTALISYAVTYECPRNVDRVAPTLGTDMPLTTTNPSQAPDEATAVDNPCADAPSVDAGGLQCAAATQIISKCDTSTPTFIVTNHGLTEWQSTEDGVTTTALTSEGLDTGVFVLSCGGATNGIDVEDLHHDVIQSAQNATGYAAKAATCGTVEDQVLDEMAPTSEAGGCLVYDVGDGLSTITISVTKKAPYYDLTNEDGPEATSSTADPASEAIPYGGEPLSKGDADESADGAVRAIQTKLSELSYLSPPQVDGNFGPATARAVRQYQSIYGLTPDGVVGLNTWDLLFPEPDGRSYGD